MQDGQTPVLVRNLLDVFNERDETKRLAIIEQIYTQTATFFEADASFVGFEKINRRVTEVLQTLPAEAHFQTVGAQTANHNLVRLSWNLALDNGAVIASGMDVALLEEDRIAALYLFLDSSTPGA